MLNVVSFLVFRTRAVQKLIESLRAREEIQLVVAALRPGFLELIKDPNGNHVVQKCLQPFGADDNKVYMCVCACILTSSEYIVDELVFLFRCKLVYLGPEKLFQSSYSDRFRKVCSRPLPLF